MPRHRFRSPAEWRRWLEDHHATETEAWVLLSKKADAGLHHEEALEEALCFGWIDGKIRAHDERSFAQRFSPRKEGSVWSESNRERAERLIREGRMRPAGFARIQEARDTGVWESATRPSRVPRMPPDMREALRANPEAWSHFQAWGSSFRAGSIRWVLDAKREETRRRAYSPRRAACRRESATRNR